MKIWLPSGDRQQVGGGFSFLRTFKKYAERAGVQILDDWQEADIGLISGVTLVQPSVVAEAERNGVPIIFRVDNVPRKSRNKRNTPHERMREIADLASVVVYQSKWAENYCKPLCGDGMIIYNGVDTEVFSPAKKKQDCERWLFAYHGKNEMKSFWAAHLLFELRARENPQAEFLFAVQFPSADEKVLAEANYDFWNGEKVTRVSCPQSPQEMADLMRQCTHYVHPAISDAAPQTVLEARACGLEVVGAASEELAGTKELLDPNLDISAVRMVEEYLALARLIHF